MKFTCLCILILSLLECLYAYSPTSKHSREWKPKVKNMPPRSLVKPSVRTTKPQLPSLHHKGITKHSELEKDNSTPNLPTTTTTEVMVPMNTAVKEDSSVSFYQYNVMAHFMGLPILPILLLTLFFDFSPLFPPVYEYDLVKYCRANHSENLITALQLSGYILPILGVLVVPVPLSKKIGVLLGQCVMSAIIYYFCPNLYFYGSYYSNLIFPNLIGCGMLGAIIYLMSLPKLPE